MTLQPFAAKHSRRALASAIQRRRSDLCRAMYTALRSRECATWLIPLQFDEVNEWGRLQILTAVDLLAEWCTREERIYLELFAGWVHSRLTPSLSQEGTPKDYKPNKAVEKTSLLWIEILKSEVSPGELHTLKSDLAEAISILAVEPIKTMRLLFIGDCLQFEAMAALVAPCAEVGLNLVSTLVNERLQPSLRNVLRSFDPKQFDLIFFSPFSHAYLPEYEALLKPKSCLWPTYSRNRHIENMLTQLFVTLDTIKNHFKCPAYVHNTGGTVQSFKKLSGVAKNLLSGRSRNTGRRIINSKLSSYLKDAGSESGLHVLDEDSLRSTHSAFHLGQVQMQSNAFHPTRLGVEVGRRLYFEALYTAAFLTTKKVVMCDLDNTLWDGVIAESAVSHYVERQRTLKELKKKGVLLTINSKNDPSRSIQWTGAVLQSEDFVAPQINWNSKSVNTARIRDELNLNVRDFVFLDDRQDELARVKKAFPEILILDSTQPLTWRLLSHWQQTRPADSAESRTKQYQQRAHRNAFFSNIVDTEDETAAIFALELSVKIRQAGKPELKRAVELVNRTNQFNLCGSRTSIRDLEEGLGKSSMVFVAEAKDKFGSMGIVGVMRAEIEADRLNIPMFVLSCRAFGFGIEYSLLNTIRSLAQPGQIIVGHYRETHLNLPCKKLYPESGLTWDGFAWIGEAHHLRPDPAWLSIDRDIISPLTKH